MKGAVGLASGAVGVLLLAGGCSHDSAGSAGVNADRGAVRAKASACFGYGLDGVVRYSLAEPGSELAVTGDCIATKDDCNDIIRCSGVEPKACQAPGSCVGTVVTRCSVLPTGTQIAWTEDCAADASGNSQCVSTAPNNQILGCNAGPCVPGTLPRCDGSALVSCYEGGEVRLDCALTGYTCATDSLGQNPSCVLAQRKACEASFCDGSTIVTCAGGLEGYRSDCRYGAPAGTCELRDGLPGCVAGERSPVCPLDTPYRSWCEGDLGIACVLGGRVVTNCSAYKGAHCAEDELTGAARCEL